MQTEAGAKKIMTAQQKGLIIGVILVLISLLSYILIPDMEDQQKTGYGLFLVVLAAIAWSGIQYAKDMNGNVTFGNVFGHSFKVAAVMTLIVVAYFILSVTVLFPEIKDKALELSYKQMSERKNMSEAQIDQAITMTKKYFLAFGIGGQLFGSLFLGAIGALIGAAIAKKNPNPTPFNG